MKIEHLSKFMLETLFYMFYAMPRDLVQALAAQELYRRDWKYHGELRMWLKARSPQEIMLTHQNVQYLHFDVNVWEPRLFNSPYRGNLAAGLLTEEDIRVRIVPPTPSAQLPMPPS
jgi:CCR4-NOT transcription complex subunit 2